MSMFKNMNGNRLKRILEILLLFAGIPLVLYIIFKVGIFLAPFVIALLISMLLEPPIRFIMRKVKLKRRLSALISLLLFLSTIGSLLALLIIRLISEIISLYDVLDQYYTSLNDSIGELITKISDFYSWLPVEVTSNLGSIFVDVSKFVIDVLNKFAKGVVTTAISMPQVFLFIIVTILSAYFLTSDRDKIYTAIRRHLPVNWQIKVQSIRNDMFSALFGYIRAQLILMSITFTELSIGFTIIGFRQPLLFALLISVFDALPIFGIGGILVPWTIYLFISGSISSGIGLAVLYIIVIIVRQLIEPKILGKQIGIHPLMTLLAMYVGMRLMGVPGLIVGPVTMLIFKNILSGFLKGRSFSDILDGKSPSPEPSPAHASEPSPAHASEPSSAPASEPSPKLASEPSPKLASEPSPKLASEPSPKLAEKNKPAAGEAAGGLTGKKDKSQD